MTGGVANHGRAAYDPASPFYATYCRAVLVGLDDDERAALAALAEDRPDLIAERLSEPGLGDLVPCARHLADDPDS